MQDKCIVINIISSGVQITIKGDQKLLWKQQTVLKKVLGQGRNELFLKNLKRLFLISLVNQLICVMPYSVLVILVCLYL
jgi:hypothetical protein